MMELMCLGLFTGCELGGHRAGERMGKLQPEPSSKNPELLPLAHPSLPLTISPKSLGTPRLSLETWNKHSG